MRNTTLSALRLIVLPLATLFAMPGLAHASCWSLGSEAEVCVAGAYMTITGTSDAEDVVLTKLSGSRVRVRYTRSGSTDTFTSSGSIADVTAYLGDGSDFYDGSALGSSYNQEIYGEAGNDTIEGGGGTDYIDGGSGSNELYGHDGDDAIHGGDDNDVIYGGKNDDDIFGYGGNDSIWSDNGDDYVFGHEGDDTIFGGGGDDNLFGGSGDDKLFGEGGNDIVKGDTHGPHPYSGDICVAESETTCER